MSIEEQIEQCWVERERQLNPGVESLGEVTQEGLAAALSYALDAVEEHALVELPVVSRRRPMGVRIMRAFGFVPTVTGKPPRIKRSWRRARIREAVIATG